MAVFPQSGKKVDVFVGCWESRLSAGSEKIVDRDENRVQRGGSRETEYPWWDGHPAALRHSILTAPGMGSRPYEGLSDVPLPVAETRLPDSDLVSCPSLILA